MRYTALVAFAATAPTVLGNYLLSRQDCSPEFKLCMPEGAKTHSLGEISGRWADLYTNIVNVVGEDKLGNYPAPQTTDPNGPGRRETGQAFCCESQAIDRMLSLIGFRLCGGCLSSCT